MSRPLAVEQDFSDNLAAGISAATYELFCEHVLSDSPRLARWQRRLAAPWAAFAEGCRCDQDTLTLIERELSVERVDRGRWRGMPPLVHPLVIGAASAPG